MVKNDFSYLKERTYTKFRNLESMDQKIRSIIINCSTSNKEKKELLHYFNKLVEKRGDKK